RGNLGVDHAHVAFQQTLHPFVAINIHKSVEADAAFCRPLDHDRIYNPSPYEPDESCDVGQGEDSHACFESLFPVMLPAWAASFNRSLECGAPLCQHWWR